MYVRNAWYVACWTHDLPDGKPSAVKILGKSIVLWRADQVLVALEDRCVHRMAPLSLGRCEGATLRCMYHGLVFDVTGTVVAIPGQAQIPSHARVRAYPVVEQHSWIWVWMGDPALADASLVPGAVGLDDPDWIIGAGQLDYGAEARLINENLLDFSHLTYVHAASFGAGPEFAEALPEITRLPRGIRYTRWTLDTASPVGGHQVNDRVDAYMAYEFVVPGILTMWNGVFPSGTAKTFGFGKPDYQLASGGVSFTSQAVTPVDARQARYFFSAGPHRLHGDERLRDAHVAIALQAFEEDRVMIEAQQRVIDSSPDAVVMPTAHDRAITLYNGLLRKLASAEKVQQGAANG